jgi:Protein of unknown function (DUF2946)
MAVLALLMAALAPSISHALSAGQGDTWTEICTAVGSRWVQADGPSSDPAPASGDVHALEHCPYCSLHANDLAIPAAPAAAAPALAGPDLLPVAFLAAPRTLHAWLSAQPRAPPFS